MREARLRAGGASVGGALQPADPRAHILRGSARHEQLLGQRELRVAVAESRAHARARLIVAARERECGSDQPGCAERGFAVGAHRHRRAHRTGAPHGAPC
jgi:hypothetical protein